MRIVVVGGTGRIGARVVELLRREEHDVVAASRSSGVDTMSGAGLADALARADALVDVTNPGSGQRASAMAFFTTSTANLVDAARAAGISHYVLLSIVGVDRVPESDYYRAKVAQERMVAESGLPWSIVRATQFEEFTEEIVDAMVAADEVRVPDALIQPVPAADVAATVARVTVSQPLTGIVEVGGPRTITFEQMAREVLARRHDETTRVVVDSDAGYFGARLGRRSLVIGE